MMLQDDNVTFYRGYGEHQTRGALAGRDPNSYRTPMPSRLSLGTLLLLGIVLGYCWHKYAKK